MEEHAHPCGTACTSTAQVSQRREILTIMPGLNRKRILTLRRTCTLEREQMRILLESMTDEEEAFLFSQAREVCGQHYGKSVFLRGLVEFSSWCRNDCYYCGLRHSNLHAQRYRLSEEQILQCADQGYSLGFRTIVLQSGEDPFYKDEDLCRIVSGIKSMHPDCAVTLSVGEKSRESYQKYFDAGADRYLLRQETSDPAHYRYLHPEPLTIEDRKRCLQDLKEIGFQTGCGIMVGSPGQTMEQVLDDLYYMAGFQPHMVGIGPFIPHKDTPFAKQLPGTVTDTLRLLAVIRLMLPSVLLPATTALGTIDPQGREKGILAGANVVMPNLSPSDVREKYLLYDGKICTGDEAAQCRQCMERRMERIGYHVETSRGDWRA